MFNAPGWSLGVGALTRASSSFRISMTSAELRSS
jgi:hypothetical protein